MGITEIPQTIRSAMFCDGRELSVSKALFRTPRSIDSVAGLQSIANARVLSCQ